MSLAIITLKREELEQTKAYRNRASEVIYHGDTYVFDSSFTKDLKQEAEAVCRKSLMNCIPSLIIEDKYELLVWKAVVRPKAQSAPGKREKTITPTVIQEQTNIQEQTKTIFYRGVQMEVPIASASSSSITPEAPKRQLTYRGQPIN